MGSLVQEGQVDLDQAMRERDERHGVSWREKREARVGIPAPVLADRADSWSKEGEGLEK